MASLPAAEDEDDYMSSSEDEAMEDDSEVLEDSSKGEELATEEDYDFVEKPSEDFYCPVSFEFLREPYQMLCCGYHLSPIIAARLRGQPCPMCKKTKLKTVADMYFKRKVNELKVRCPNKSLGCEWVGELGSLDRHLSQNSVEGECQFMTVACPYNCGDSFQRCQLEGHKANDCSNRPFTCQYCDLKATFTEVIIEHWPICKQYPLKCPNKCGENAIERQHLPKHVEETCPLQVIKCEFSYAGCEVECQRQHMHNHEANMKIHFNKVSHTLHCKIEQQQSIIEQLQKQIVALMSALTQVALDVKKPLAPVFVPPSDIVMTDFDEHKKAGDWWYSPPFYSHIAGYKMCLRVQANGQGFGEDTHVSVFVHLMQGEYDDKLKWPYRGDITIQLLNQSSDEGHREVTVPFDDTVGGAAAGRVVGRERAAGFGYSQFIAHTELKTENKVYLKNDCLVFQIPNFVVKSI